MSFNQKVVSVITFLTIGISCVVTAVCFEPPYSVNFWVAFAVVVFSQFIFGAFGVQQIGKSDLVLPFSIGVWGINALYFLFAIGTTFLTGMEEKNFILLQVIGFVVMVILQLFFGMVEHHVEDLSKDDPPSQKIERAKVTWR